MIHDDAAFQRYVALRSDALRCALLSPAPLCCAAQPCAALRCAAGAARVALPRCLERPLFSKVAGMKTAFWREAITPGAVAAGGYEFVWLFDNDLAVDAVDLPALARTMAKVGTPLIQPRIAGSDDYFVHLRAHPEPPVPPNCLAVSTNYIAPWAPFFAA